MVAPLLGLIGLYALSSLPLAIALSFATSLMLGRLGPGAWPDAEPDLWVLGLTVAANMVLAAYFLSRQILRAENPRQKALGIFWDLVALANVYVFAFFGLLLLLLWLGYQPYPAWKLGILAGYATLATLACLYLLARIYAGNGILPSKADPQEYF